ncbi:MAG: hypothetical protein QW578_05725 [Thermoplasmatales archaeon]
MSELKRKDKNLQIYVTNDTYIKFQKAYYDYKSKYKYRSREEFLLLLLTHFTNRNTLDLLV